MTSPGDTRASPVSAPCPPPHTHTAGARLRRRPFPHVFSVFPVVYVAFQVHTEPGARLSFLESQACPFPTARAHWGLLCPRGGHRAGVRGWPFQGGAAWAGSPGAGVCNRSPGMRHSWWRPRGGGDGRALSSAQTAPAPAPARRESPIAERSLSPVPGLPSERE